MRLFTIDSPPLLETRHKCSSTWPSLESNLPTSNSVWGGLGIPGRWPGAPDSWQNSATVFRLFSSVEFLRVVLMSQEILLKKLLPACNPCFIPVSDEPKSFSCLRWLVLADRCLCCFLISTKFVVVTQDLTVSHHYVVYLRRAK